MFCRSMGNTLSFESVPFTAGRMTADGVRYHVTDHLGSVRAVIDGSTGDILEASEYSSYGGRTDLTSTVQSLWDSNPSSSLPANRYHFSGKEDQAPDFSISSTDFGARHYAPHLSRWIVPDPMSEKYYDISPYVYCAGDPVNYVDPRGDTLLFAPGSSEEFKKRFAETVRFMNEHGTSYNIARIHASPMVYYIAEGKENSFRPSSRTIVWNPTKVAYDNQSNYLRSPATTLAHEFGHAYRFDSLLQQGYQQNEIITIMSKETGDEYDNTEEKRVITTTEQYAARAHGEIDPDQVTRTRHSTDPTKYPKDQPDFSQYNIIQMVVHITAFNRGIYLP